MTGAGARGWIRGGLAAALVALIALPLAAGAAVWVEAQAAPAEGTPETADRATDAALAGPADTLDSSRAGTVDGERIFARACASCHGMNGSGRIGPELAGNDNLRRADYVMALILRGGDGMPAFHDRLSEAEVAAVTEHIRTSWGNDFAAGNDLSAANDFASSNDPSRIGDSVAFTEELLVSRWWTGADGAGDLYRRVCARCHGADGGGGFGPPLAGNDNLSDPVYTVGKILHGQGGMPAFEGILTSARITELASYIRSSFGNGYGEVQLGTTLSLHSIPPSTGSGALAVSLIPADARIVVIGPDRFVRILSGTGLVTLEDLAPGEYTVTASAEGYEGEVESVQVLPGERSRASLLLLPSAERPQRAQATSQAGEERERDASAATGEPLTSGEGEEQRAQSEARADADPADASGATPLPLEQDEVFTSPPAPPPAVLDLGTRGVDRVTATPYGDEPRAISSNEHAVYQSSCALCHGPEGEGGIGPALADNQNLQSGQFVLQRILHGAGRMPAFSDRLDDRQIAAAASHEMTSWGNSFGEVSAQQVASARSDGAWAEAGTSPDRASGATLYSRHCAACHGGQGGGIAAPGFRGNARLADASYVVSRVVMGGGGMPAFHEVLSTAEMAAVSSFIREAWGNDFGRVSVLRAQNYHGGQSSLQE